MEYKSGNKSTSLVLTVFLEQSELRAVVNAVVRVIVMGVCRTNYYPPTSAYKPLGRLRMPKCPEPDM